MPYFTRISEFALGFKFNRLVVALVVLLALPLLVHGQSSEGTIVGTVTDPSGAVMPNVKITISSGLTGAVRALETNDDGQYVVAGLGYRQVRGQG